MSVRPYGPAEITEIEKVSLSGAQPTVHLGLIYRRDVEGLIAAIRERDGDPWEAWCRTYGALLASEESMEIDVRDFCAGWCMSRGMTFTEGRKFYEEKCIPGGMA